MESEVVVVSIWKRLEDRNLLRSVRASSDILIRLPLPLIKAEHKKRNYCQGRPGYALPLHLQKDQLLECCPSQGPLSQSKPAGAI